MITPVKALFALLLLLLLARPAAASGDIVYSARYYYPPSVHKTSHFHIYRIDPSGRHRAQLTYGDKDEFDPHWSPNGRWICFQSSAGYQDPNYIVVMDPSGRQHKIAKTDGIVRLIWSVDSRGLGLSDEYGSGGYKTIASNFPIRARYWPQGALPGPEDSVSPNHRYRYDFADTGNNGVITDTISGKAVATTKVHYSGAYWLSNSEFVGLYSYDNEDANTDSVTGRYEFAYIGIDGNIRRAVGLSEPKYLEKLTSQNAQFAADFWELDPWPGKPGSYLGWQSWHNSTVGTDFGLFYMDPEKGKFRYLAESQFAAWSPDRKTICISPGKITSNYQLRENGIWKVVLTAPLQIVDIQSGKLRTLQDGLIWVTGADWRQHNAGK